MAGTPLAVVFDILAVDRASHVFKKVGHAAGSAGVEAESGMKKFAGALAPIGLAALAAGVLSVKMASDFRSSMLLLQTQAGASSGEVKKLSGAVLDLAPQVGFGPVKLAESLYHIESVGLRGSKAMQVLKLAAEGAAVGHADLEQTTNALTAAVASGMKGTENYAAAMGKLNAIVGAGDMKMQDLNDAMSTGVLVTMKQYGVTLNDVGAALATFGDNNIRGQFAATQLRMAVQALAKPAVGGAKALASIGLSAKQLQDDLQRGGLNLALTDLHGHLVRAGKSGTLAGQLLTDAFGKRAGSGLQILNGQIDRFHTKLNVMSHTDAKTFGDAWAAVNKTLGQQFNDVRAGVEALAIRIGNKLIPVIQSVIGWAQKHKEIMKDLAFAIGVVAVGAVAALTVALLANPFVLITAAVVAVIAAFKHWYDTSRDGKAILTGIWSGLLAAFQGMIYGITKGISKALQAAAWLADAMGFHGMAKGLRNAAKSVDEFGKDIDRSLDKAKRSAMEKAAALGVNIWTGIDSQRAHFQAVADKYHTTMNAVLDLAGVDAKRKAAILAESINTGVKTGLPGILSTSQNLAGAPGRAFRDAEPAAFAAAQALGGNLGQGLIAGIQAYNAPAIAAAQALGTAVTRIMGTTLKIASPSKITTYFGQMLGEGLARGIESKYGRVAAAADGMGKEAVAAMRFLAERALVEVKGKLTALKPAIRSMETDLAGLRKEADAFADSLASNISGKVDVGSMFSGIMSGQKTAQSALDAAQQNVGTAAQNLKDLQDRLSWKPKLSISDTQQLRKAQESLTDATDAAAQAQTDFNKAQAAAANPVAGLTASLQDQLKKTKAFGDQLKKLAAAGASKDLLSQIAASGADAGGALATALLASGPKSVKSISSLMAQITKAGETAAAAISARYYQHGINSMQALINGMKAKESALQAQVARITRLLVALSSGAQALYDMNHPDPAKAAHHRGSTHHSSTRHHTPVVAHSMSELLSEVRSLRADVKQMPADHQRLIRTR